MIDDKKRTESEELPDIEEHNNILEDDSEDSDEILEIEEELFVEDDDVVEIEESEEISETPIENPFLSMDDPILSKHTAEGKHSLKYDSIFKGKKDEVEEDEDFEKMMINETFEVDKSSHFWAESIDNENYIKDKRVKEKVYEVLEKYTDLNFLNNRRKPSKVDFNKYYFLLKTHLKSEKFTNIEIFNELSVYFSDNLFNMFKLLDNKWRNMIINELQEHIGKKRNSTDLVARNIHVGTEIEFQWTGDDNKSKLITGVVTECDYDSKQYTVDSYESIYDVNMNSITRILNNSKFKYNLNKLNNIDFL